MQPVIVRRAPSTKNRGHPAGRPGESRGDPTGRAAERAAFDSADNNDLWRVRGPHGTADSHFAGRAIQHGDVIRLQHVLTGLNLHSHPGHPSPSSGQQEVTCYGPGGVGDSNDNWRVELDGPGFWSSGTRLRLIHVNTGHALHSHLGHSEPVSTAGQQEVTAFPYRDHNDWWWMFELR